eukprot:TRINITY_DN2024_c0_g1_i1.p1 TRINITY_DN2024_c0_g1~~TRINITY_DN2024_c0_g1_i1.p1  ORF type:complete len:364 (+),score=133.96 TRINITY_DN2024_c0_g1_i1:83-1093(+)
MCIRDRFDAEHHDKVLALNMKGKLDLNKSYLTRPSLSPEARDLLAKTLDIDPKKRLTPSEAIHHEYFDNFVGEDQFMEVASERDEEDEIPVCYNIKRLNVKLIASLQGPSPSMRSPGKERDLLSLHSDSRLCISVCPSPMVDHSACSFLSSPMASSAGGSPFLSETCFKNASSKPPGRGVSKFGRELSVPRSDLNLFESPIIGNTGSPITPCSAAVHIDDDTADYEEDHDSMMEHSTDKDSVSFLMSRTKRNDINYHRRSISGCPAANLMNAKSSPSSQFQSKDDSVTLTNTNNQSKLGADAVRMNLKKCIQSSVEPLKVPHPKKKYNSAAFPSFG